MGSHINVCCLGCKFQNREYEIFKTAIPVYGIPNAEWHNIF